MSRFAVVASESRPLRPGDELLPLQIRYHEMQVLCGACSGLGCQLCEPLAPPRSRWARLRAWLGGAT